MNIIVKAGMLRKKSVQLKYQIKLLRFMVNGDEFSFIRPDALDK